MTTQTHKIIDGLASLATPIDSLTGLEGNYRRHEIEALARSLDRFGQRKPIVVRRDGAIVEAGNGTTIAARDVLGWTHIAAVFVEDDEATAIGFALADNRTHDLGSNDEHALALMVRGIRDEELLLLDAGFDALAVDDLLAPLDLDPIAPEGRTLNDGRTPGERQAEYEAAGLRSFILTYAMEDYEAIGAKLQALRASMSLDTNGEVIAKLVLDAAV